VAARYISRTIQAVIIHTVKRPLCYHYDQKAVADIYNVLARRTNLGIPLSLPKRTSFTITDFTKNPDYLGTRTKNDENDGRFIFLESD
jgi:hypothetical protein